MGTVCVVKRRAAAVGALAALLAAGDARAAANPEEAARAVVTRFEQALQDRDAAAVAPLVAEDVVVFENGHRNDGWRDFRDNHLVPEMKEPGHPMKVTPMKLRATARMAWAYTRTDLFADPSMPRRVSHVLWSVYVLEARPEGWRIVALDWSIGKQK